MNPISIVTIKELLPLWKGEEAATKIQLCHLEENGFDLVVGNDLYQVGDKAVYIQPDFCLPDNVELFSSFTAPEGNPNKSRLGKGNRIKAIKFNFHKGDNVNVFSVGILLPYHEVMYELSSKGINVETVTEDILNEHLGVYKYEAPETGKSGQAKGDLPLGMYATDENNFENIVRRLEFPLTLIGTLKIDGSSHTTYWKSVDEKGICSRNMEKHLVQKIVTGYKNGDDQVLRKHFNKDTNQRGWLNDVTNEFFVEVPECYIPIETEVEDSWIKHGMPILNKLEQFCLDNNRQIAVRGELHGQGLKGSGNKNNRQLARNLQVFNQRQYLCLHGYIQCG